MGGEVVGAMTCGYCKDCKWWELRPHSFREPWGRCLKTHNERSEGEQSLAHAYTYAPDRTAFLLTHPDFGCVQWEAKESTCAPH